MLSSCRRALYYIWLPMLRSPAIRSVAYSAGYRSFRSSSEIVFAPMSRCISDSDSRGVLCTPAVGSVLLDSHGTSHTRSVQTGTANPLLSKVTVLSVANYSLCGRIMRSNSLRMIFVVVSFRLSLDPASRSKEQLLSGNEPFCRSSPCTSFAP